MEYVQIPVMATICPFLRALMDGKADFIRLTGAKKFVSNWSRTSDCARSDCDNSSIEPTMASLWHIARMSIRPNAPRASATADWHCPIALLVSQRYSLS